MASPYAGKLQWLKDDKDDLYDPSVKKTEIKHYVLRWYVMSILTSRYITSPESAMDYDIKRVEQRGFLPYFSEVESTELSGDFWSGKLLQNLESASVNSPYLSVFFAAQVFFGDSSLFNNGLRVADLIGTQGEVHHIFPRKYLLKNGIKERNLDPQVNKAVGDDSSNTYFSKAFDSIDSEGKALFGSIGDRIELEKNLSTNAIPSDVLEMDYTRYDDFLVKRRKLMADKIKAYYYSL